MDITIDTSALIAATANESEKAKFDIEALKLIQPTRSPLDIVGVNLNLSTAEIVDVIREMRERH